VEVRFWIKRKWVKKEQEVFGEQAGGFIDSEF
jgi:hypothetical protein